jgi:hypothetical protein
MKKIYGSNLFLIAGLAVLAIGGSQFYQTCIKPHLHLD